MAGAAETLYETGSKGLSKRQGMSTTLKCTKELGWMAAGILAGCILGCAGGGPVVRYVYSQRAPEAPDRWNTLEIDSAEGGLQVQRWIEANHTELQRAAKLEPSLAVETGMYLSYEKSAGEWVHYPLWTTYPIDLRAPKGEREEAENLSYRALYELVSLFID